MPARVVRDGTQAGINAEGVVPDDLLFLEAGDMVPANARLLDAAQLWGTSRPSRGSRGPPKNK